ncbi:uncharacterized protein F5Z01DRAFT_197642 [Emericellopsis atlantica]|uniref:Uncharacterized protein n=1 Tax=Emericellopsis atlantica TaxID=2614577 RepID=A0A9P7ZU96_9HYPO|nr:uncharacterized protein F5Z01DRAFT_197642 [Emericellopsis atlantica]KAG9258458.1 hypothetical protein F5Z01DRAFT_197642 [Emericellopsis atlantica]
MYAGATDGVLRGNPTPLCHSSGPAVTPEICEELQSSACVDYVPALCTPRLSLLSIEWLSEASGLAHGLEKRDCRTGHIASDWSHAPRSIGPHPAVIRETVCLTFEEERIDHLIRGKPVERIATILGLGGSESNSGLGDFCRLNRLAATLARKSLRRNGIDVPEDGGRYKKIIEKVAKALSIKD